MSTELIINASLPETRIALMENGEIQELLIERASGKGIVGNIYKGRVTRVLPGMQAAFVDIGLEKAAFLYVDDVYVHSEIWEAEEGGSSEGDDEGTSSSLKEPGILPVPRSESVAVLAGESTSEANADAPTQDSEEEAQSTENRPQTSDSEFEVSSRDEEDDEDLDTEFDEESFDLEDDDSDDEEEEEEEEDRGPVEMGAGPGDDDSDGSSGNREQPSGTIAPNSPKEESSQNRGDDSAQMSGSQDESSSDEGSAGGPDSAQAGSDPKGESRRRHRRGRRGGRNRRRGSERGAKEPLVQQPPQEGASTENYPDNFYKQMSDENLPDSDRSAMTDEGVVAKEASGPIPVTNRPEKVLAAGEGVQANRPEGEVQSRTRPEFKETRSRDRRVRPKASSKPARGQVNIQDLLKEGQEVLVQVAKDPISTKGARLTCHISLPGRHLVCMPTIDHVGVSRRIEREDERRKLREYVERNRPRNLGFIVRTASGKSQSEKRIKQDIEYLTRLWTEIREKAANVTAPALVYEDLNSVLRAIRDWVTEEIDKVIVDSRYHYNEIQRFVSHFMPSLRQKVELYHGDIPIFDAYGISTELSRALERKVWLKSGGYIVVDQAEALVAIDVNTGRYVGKKNLEDTILKTNLEAVEEIAYQLRLRNCGGIIILDLIDMEKEENKFRVHRALEEALKKDRARPTILKISELGLIEMTRKRTRDTITRSLCESCTHCEGKGFIKSKQTVGYEVMREIERAGIEKDVGKILVQAHSDVIDILAIDERESLDQLERRYRKTIFLQTVGDYHPEQFEVSTDKKPQAERSREFGREGQGESSGSQSRDRNNRGGRGGGRDRNDRNRNQQRERPPGTGTGTVIITPKNPDSTSTEGSAPVIRPVGSGDSGDSSTFQGNDASGDGQNFDSGGNPNASGTLDGQPGSMGDGSQSPRPRRDEEFEEEDRLAFLRAQAAQDAALARLAASGNPAATTGQNRPGFSRGPSAGAGGARNNNNNNNNKNRRGRRGGRGRFGGGRGPDRDRGPNAGPSTGPIPIPREEAKSTTPANATGNQGSSSDSGNGNGGGGGGGDHSQPPV